MLLLRSFGLKRLITSWLNVIVEVLRVVPGSSEYIAVIELLAGYLGITGIGHAGINGDLTKKKLATASAAVASLVLVSTFVPQLAPLRPVLEKLAALLGAAALATNVKK